MATEFAVAKTPGPGMDPTRLPLWKRSSTSSFCVFFDGFPSRPTKARIIAPSAAVISSADVSSNANRYSVKSFVPRLTTLPPLVVFASARPTGCTEVSARATEPTIRTANPMPSNAAASRWPRMTSTTESELSRPTIISTNRNSIMIAPV